MYEYWWNRLVLTPNGGQDKLAEWNRQDLTAFDDFVFFGNIDGNQAGSITASVVPVFSGNKNVLKLEFNSFYGGALLAFTGTFSETRFLNVVEWYSGSAAFNEAYFFVAPFIDTTTKNGLLLSSKFSANDLHGIYLQENSCSLKQDFGSTWHDIDGNYFKQAKFYTNFKPTSQHLQYRTRSLFNAGTTNSFVMTSLSHSAPVAWSGSTFNKNGIGILVTGSVARTGVVYIYDALITKHPYDIDS